MVNPRASLTKPAPRQPSNVAPRMDDCYDIDRAATAGYEAFSTGAKIPRWAANDEMLAMAWSAGRRQAADKAASRKHNGNRA